MDTFHDDWFWVSLFRLSWVVYENIPERDVYAKSPCPIKTAELVTEAWSSFTQVCSDQSTELQCQHKMENTVIRGLLIIVTVHGENIRAAVVSVDSSRMGLTCLLGVFLLSSRCLEWKTGSVSAWSKTTWRDSEDVLHHFRVWHDQLLHPLGTTETRESSGVDREDGCRFKLCYLWKLFQKWLRDDWRRVQQHSVPADQQPDSRGFCCFLLCSEKHSDSRERNSCAKTSTDNKHGSSETELQSS